mmetsp:Transcript_58617/g.156944  ORF Transcript_58617/g.156944 Transcript_58617/m.156944 type:complete len:101 (+) Transcript_58617:94-396(+)
MRVRHAANSLHRLDGADDSCISHAEAGGADVAREYDAVNAARRTLGSLLALHRRVMYAAATKRQLAAATPTKEYVFSQLLSKTAGCSREETNFLRRTLDL